MNKTTKKQFDKFLTRLFVLQRECFKSGSGSSLEVRPVWDGDFTIYVLADNKNVNKWIEHEDGTKEPYHFEHFPLYSFYSVEENEEQMKKIKDFLTDTDNEQH